MKIFVELHLINVPDLEDTLIIEVELAETPAVGDSICLPTPPEVDENYGPIWGSVRSRTIYRDTVVMRAENCYRMDPHHIESLKRIGYEFDSNRFFVPLYESCIVR